MHCQWHSAYCWTRRCSSFAVSPCATGTAQRSRNQIAYVFQSGRQGLPLLRRQMLVSVDPPTRALTGPLGPAPRKGALLVGLA